MSVQYMRRLELALFGAGLAAAVAFCTLAVPSILARSTVPQVASSAEDKIFPVGSMTDTYMAGGVKAPASSVIGRMSIPALSINAPVVEGIQDSDLLKGVGHIPGSAMAGGLGNMILAAHRDRIFRPLRDVRVGMDIQVEEGGETYHYKVDSLDIVSPERLDVMALASEPQVTLITCYPFNFIGSAPKRFIVKGHLVSVMADGSSATP